MSSLPLAYHVDEYNKWLWGVGMARESRGDTHKEQAYDVNKELKVPALEPQTSEFQKALG